MARNFFGFVKAGRGKIKSHYLRKLPKSPSLVDHPRLVIEFFIKLPSELSFFLPTHSFIWETLETLKKDQSYVSKMPILIYLRSQTLSQDFKESIAWKIKNDLIGIEFSFVELQKTTQTSSRIFS